MKNYICSFICFLLFSCVCFFAAPFLNWYESYYNLKHLYSFPVFMLLLIIAFMSLFGVPYFISVEQSKNKP